MITAYDPVNASIRFNGWREAWDQDRQDLATLTRRALRLYKGKHQEELQNKLNQLFQSSELRSRYAAVSIKINVLRMLVTQVATIGQTPVVVQWDNDPDQAKWDRIADKGLGLHRWDTVVPFLAQDTEVAKNVAVTVTWNKRHEHIDLGFYYPHTCDVGWKDPQNPDYAHPDFFGILNEPAKHAGVFFDVDGGKGYLLSEAGSVTDIQQMPVKDEKTVRPWVTFRAAPPRCGYWTDDGLEDLVDGQASINWLWTQRAILIHYGAFKIPILDGDWVERDGTLPAVVLDPSKPIKLPEDLVPSNGQKRKLWWDGPDNVANIDAIGKTTYDLTMAMAASLGLHESAITSSNEPASGYSVQVNTGPLRVRHRTSRTVFRPQLEELVSVIRDVWDVYSGDPFSDSGTYRALIGDYWAGTIPRDEVGPDLQLMGESLVSRKTLVRKYNPGISETEIDELIAEAESKAQLNKKVGFDGQ